MTKSCQHWPKNQSNYAEAQHQAHVLINKLLKSSTSVSNVGPAKDGTVVFPDHARARLYMIDDSVSVSVTIVTTIHVLK